MSLFIVFEGEEGCGKSLQSGLLYEKLCALGVPAILNHEPGGTPLGEEISRLLKSNGDIEISPMAELLLFNASRSQLVGDIIRPALEKGQVVVCDRYTASTVVYQGYGRGLDMGMVKGTNDASTGGLAPDITFLLDMPVAKGLARKAAGSLDRFEREQEAFHDRVRQGYLALAAAEPGRWCVIDADQDKDTISEAVWRRVSPLLPRKD
jgi:dTMP kinase